MKNISAFKAIFIAVFVVAAVAGIFVFATYSGSSHKAATIGKVVIWGTLPKNAMTQTLATVTKQNKDMKSVTYVQKQASTFKQDLTAAIAAGNGPDLVLISQSQLTPLSSVLTQIPYKTFSQSTFLNAYVNAATAFIDAKGVYGLPVAIDPMVMYYNTSMLASAGIVEPPKDWEALTGLVPHLAQISSSQRISRALIGMGTYDNVHDARGVLSSLFLQAGVSMVSRSATGRLHADFGLSAPGSSAPGAETAPGVAVVRFYTQFADPSKVSYTWNSTLPDSQQAFLSGDVALYLGYASENQFLSQANPNLSYRIAPMPQSATANIQTTYANVYALAIPHGSRNTNGAFMAAQALSGGAGEQAIAKNTGMVPVLRSLLAQTPSDPVGSVTYPAAVMARTWLSPSLATTNQIFSSMIQSVNAGGNSPGQALGTASQLIQKAL